MSTERAKWELDHIGIAVTSLKKSAELYLSLPGHRLEEEEENSEHAVKIAFISCGQGLIELMEPTSESSPVAKFLAKKGEGLHHICYRVQSVDEEIARLRATGARLVDQAARSGSRGYKVAFLHPEASRSGVLIEICSK